MIKRVLAGVGAIGLLLAASGVQAQNGPCTLTNWSSTVPVEGTNLKVGTVAQGNRRYAGPCGLNVDLENADAYLIDTTPVDETVFNVRFYFFLNNVALDVVLYQAMDGSAVAFGAKYVAATESIDVVFNPATASTLNFPVSAGWNSLEIQWSSDVTATPIAILGNSSGSTTKTSAVIDTSSFAVDSARLGATTGFGVTNVPSTGSIDFDDYDSRRDTVPGRLCRGLTNPDRAVQELNLEDVQAIFDDFATGGANPAAGTPDFDGNGTVDLQDVSDVFGRFATGQNACSANR